jgi:uncharacterized 2Fe-2S/4Fe-4S cluster protein (DUF4445 family)
VANHTVTFLPSEKTVIVSTGTLITEALLRAGLDILQPCGGQGRCGRCAVRIEGEGARRRSTLRLSKEDLDDGYALACQTVIEGNITVTATERERLAPRLVTTRSAEKIILPFEYDPASQQTLQSLQIALSQPTINDSRDDASRLKTGLAEFGIVDLQIPLPLLRKMGDVLRKADWSPWILIEHDSADEGRARLLEISDSPVRPIGLAIDIGTTTVSAYLLDLETGDVLSSAAEYNGQIARGEDVISRIIYASKGDGLQELGILVRETVDTLLERIQRRSGLQPGHIYKVAVGGNTTMIHLFLGLPPASIRLTPYIPTVNHPQVYRAAELDMNVNPLASVECLPGVASYVGADITAGVLASGLNTSERLTLFIDVGTNGEIVLGNQEWMVTCACSAGPAFEGAGVLDGMRATKGAIEEVWVHSETFEPTFRVIGGGKPEGLCGSGLISLLAELFITGVIDRSGNVKLDLPTARARQGDHGPEYVIAWADETISGRNIVLTKVDIDNLLRAKGAIYAGFSVLASSVGLELSDVEQVLVGGSFGKYINVEKAIQIGLLPDLPWDRFHFLGNTSILGTTMALLSKQSRQDVRTIGEMMTYIELSADNSFYDAFTAALFLPHTDITQFPTVAEIWERNS